MPLEFWAVSKDEYSAFSLDHNLELIEASAASGHNISEIFVILGRQILTTNRNSLAEVHADPNDMDKGSIILREFSQRKKTNNSNNSCCNIS